MPIMFVYGSLRKGGDLHSLLHGPAMLGEGRVRDACLAMAPGNEFPVLTPFAMESGPGVDWREWYDALGRGVKGEVYIVQQWFAEHVVMMELNAGYNAEWLDVEMDDGETMLDCLTFTWRRPDGIGALIPSGDWFDR